MAKPTSREPELPERDVDRLVCRLHRHRLCNGLLAVMPPLLFLAYAITLLFVIQWMDLGLWLFSLAGIIGVGLAVFFHFRTEGPTREEVARLLDKQLDGKEHFLTLANLHRLRAEPWAVARLRGQVSSLLRRTDFRRDFPYRMRQDSALSLVLSAVGILLLYLGLANPVLPLTDGGALEKAQDLAKRFSRDSGLERLAMGAQKAAAGLRAKIRSTPMIEEVMKQLETQLGSGSRDGERSGQGGGSSRKKSERGAGQRDQTNSAGGNQTGQGEGDGDGDSGEAPGEAQEGMAKLADGAQGESRPSNGAERSDRSGSGGTGNQDDGRRDATNDSGPTARGKRDGGPSGTAKSEENIPTGKEPDRFHPPGQGKGGIEGGRFVTVALPKALSRGGGQEAAGEGEGDRSTPSVPVSNIPLPPRDDPEAPNEIQHMPREYERLIN